MPRRIDYPVTTVHTAWLCDECDKHFTAEELCAHHEQTMHVRDLPSTRSPIVIVNDASTKATSPPQKRRKTLDESKSVLVESDAEFKEEHWMKTPARGRPRGTYKLSPERLQQMMAILELIFDRRAVLFAGGKGSHAQKRNAWMEIWCVMDVLCL